MYQTEFITASKVNESILYSIGYKPFTVEALYIYTMEKIKRDKETKQRMKESLKKNQKWT